MSPSQAISGSATGEPARLTQADLRWLVCPVCHGALQLAGANIACAACARHFPIVDGLPVLLADRATPLG
jgi:uncharacterized protein YbaR (Trm112 family)